jgi:hypothetical protein
MQSVRLTMLFFHLAGLSALLGGFMVQMRGTRRVLPLMLAGAIVQLVSGVLLVAAREAQDLPVNNQKLGVKMIVALGVLVTAWLGLRRPSSKALFFATGLLTAGNVAVAVFWT